MNLTQNDETELPGPKACFAKAELCEALAQGLPTQAKMFLALAADWRRLAAEYARRYYE